MSLGHVGQVTWEGARIAKTQGEQLECWTGRVSSAGVFEETRTNNTSKIVLIETARRFGVSIEYSSVTLASLFIIK